VSGGQLGGGCDLPSDTANAVLKKNCSKERQTFGASNNNLEINLESDQHYKSGC
jgi:hypothetical protein